MSFFLDFFESKISVTVNLYCGLVSIKTEEVSLCLQLRGSPCKILISSFAHKLDFAHNFSVDFF